MLDIRPTNPESVSLTYTGFLQALKSGLDEKGLGVEGRDLECRILISESFDSREVQVA